MNYAILIYDGPARFAKRSDPQHQPEVFGAIMRYIDELKQAGVYVDGAGLEPPPQAKTLRIKDGERYVQDGPYADTKEQLGGFFLIDVPDLDTALKWAARLPQENDRVLEVRPQLTPPAQE